MKEKIKLDFYAQGVILPNGEKTFIVTADHRVKGETIAFCGRGKDHARMSSVINVGIEACLEGADKIKAKNIKPVIHYF